MKTVSKVIFRVGCGVLLLCGVLGQPALADCPAGDVPLFFGNLGGLTLVPINLADPGGSFVGTYFAQSTAVNQGAADPSGWAFDLGDGTIYVQGDWSAGLGFAGCPYTLETSPDRNIANDPLNQVFYAGDSSGLVIIAAGSGTGTDFPRDLNFDLAATDGAFRKTTPDMLRPEVASATTGSGSVTLELRWAGAAINADAKSTEVAGSLVSYSVLASLSDGSPASALPDQDGSTNDAHAVVALQQGAPGSRLTATLRVQGDLRGATGPVGRSFAGAASSTIILDPLLADSGPGKGKGKGLIKAPGQQR